MSAAPVLLDYAAVRSQIRDMDVIAFEGRGLVSRLIALFTGGSVTHVGVAMWWGEVLMLLESRELRGHRVVHLSREIRKANGALLYRPDFGKSIPWPRFGKQDRAIQWARRAAGAPYSYRGLVRYLRRKMPTLLCWLPAPARDSLTFEPRFCSAFVSAIYRIAGVDLRGDLGDSETSPAELVAATSLRLVGRMEIIET